VICDSESCGPAAPSSSVPKVRLPLALPVNLFISAIMALKLPPRSCIWSFSRTASLALIKKRNFNKRYSSSDLHGETYASCLDYWRSLRQLHWLPTRTHPPALINCPVLLQSHQALHGCCAVRLLHAVSDHIDGQSRMTQGECQSKHIPEGQDRLTFCEFSIKIISHSRTSAAWSLNLVT
jgi:hypothetical protein